ncbi:MAG TPA: hypothetical protein VGB42_03125 [Candidatus Thermoplasmatota archaeon]
MRTQRCPGCERESPVVDLNCDCGYNFASGEQRFVKADDLRAGLRSLLTLPARGGAAYLRGTVAAIREGRAGDAALHLLGLVAVVGALLFVTVGLSNPVVPQEQTPHWPLRADVVRAHVLQESHVALDPPPVLEGGTRGVPVVALWTGWPEGSQAPDRLGVALAREPFGLVARPVTGVVGYDGWAGSTDPEGHLWLLWRDRATGVVTTAVSADSGATWSTVEPGVGADVPDDVDLRTFRVGPHGAHYLVRIGRRPLRLFRRAAAGVAWRDEGPIPHTDKLNRWEPVGFGVSPGGEMGLAGIDGDGRVRLVTSRDGGRSWTARGGPRMPRLRRGRALNRSPEVAWVGEGWGLVWERSTTIPVSVGRAEHVTDVLFARYDAARGRWRTPVFLNDRRAPREEWEGLVNPSMLVQRSRLTQHNWPRRPVLAVAPAGRLAVVWIELRGEKLQAVTTLSDDGGASWSEAALASVPGRGHVVRAGARFRAEGALSVVYTRHAGGVPPIDPGALAVEVVELAFSAIGGG